MSKQLFIVKIFGGTIMAASILLVIFLLSIIKVYDIIAAVYLTVPIITLIGGTLMLLAKEE